MFNQNPLKIMENIFYTPEEIEHFEFWQEAIKESENIWQQMEFEQSLLDDESIDYVYV